MTFCDCCQLAGWTTRLGMLLCKLDERLTAGVEMWERSVATPGVLTTS